MGLSLFPCLPLFAVVHFWRKGWDSNPRGSVNPLAVFKTAALNHSATLPSVEFFRKFHHPFGALVKWSQKWSPTTGTLPYQGW